MMHRPIFVAGALWILLLLKLIFYCSLVPRWEGYDEFAHFAFVGHLVNNHTLPALKDAAVSDDIVQSLHDGPVPWTIRNWTPDWIAHDDYWSGHRSQPANAPAAPVRQYEAQQPPLAYVIYAVPYAMVRNASLGVRAWIVRITGSLIASLVIPLAFVIARRVFGNPNQALAVAAIVASMPELMMTADHGGNEPLAIVLGSLCVYALCFGGPLLLGCMLGLGLLTKAYFLTMLPAIALVYMIRYRRRAAKPLLITFGIAIAIAGWWYARAWYVTGSLTGTQFAGQVAGSPTQIHWLRVADFALVSHVWIGGWSFLVLRTWMYRAVEIIFLAAAAGLAIRAARKRIPPPVGICITTLAWFWLGMAYFAYATYVATGEAAVLGYYAYALVVPEAICLMAGLATRFAAPALVTFFAALEVYGTVFFLMPYYAGITRHTVRGSVPAARIGQLFQGGLFHNLAVNKPAFLTPGVLLGLCLVFLMAAAGIVTVSWLLAFGESGEARTGAADRLVALGPG